MGEQLSMLDAMFLELEQFDESAHMHIGAALIPVGSIIFSRGRTGRVPAGCSEQSDAVRFMRASRRSRFQARGI